MQIEVKKTIEWQPSEWITYTQNFNQVFAKEYSVEFFKHKYLNSIDNHSYHAFLKEEGEIVGACTIIPYNYVIKEQIVRLGLVVDVFIVEKNRTNPLSLYWMYRKLKTELINNDIALVIAVPNDMVYPYWKNIVKWKDIGFINYYALPVRVGNVIKKIPDFINPLSLLGTKLLIVISKLFNVQQKDYAIRINRTSIVEKQRYMAEHQQIYLHRSYFSFRMVNEEGINTCYLIDFYNQNNGKKDNRSLREAVNYIFKKEKPDLILFVGKLSLFQFLLFKVPFKYEPKRLYFMADILIKEKINNFNLIYNINNWDFGLFNYDVR